MRKAGAVRGTAASVGAEMEGLFVVMELSAHHADAEADLILTDEFRRPHKSGLAVFLPIDTGLLRSSGLVPIGSPSR